MGTEKGTVSGIHFGSGAPMAENRNGIISTVAMFAFGWDIPDGGAERLFAKAAANGITRVYITSVYHAGYFLQTHHHLSRVYMVEDGVAYFRPTSEIHKDCRLKPIVSSSAIVRICSRQRHGLQRIMALSCQHGMSACTIRRLGLCSQIVPFKMSLGTGMLTHFRRVIQRHGNMCVMFFVI